MHINFEAELNPQQLAAVTAPEGPALVLAGAGSGKTRTLTYRVAYLVQEKNVAPWNILLLTFTNKAAREMLGRVEELTGIPTSRFWGGTFHSVAMRVLRQHGHHVGLGPNFTLLDQQDAETLLGQVIRAQDPLFLKNKDNPRAKALADIISYARNTQESPGMVAEERYSWLHGLSEKAEQFAAGYTAIKRKQNVLDYDDLLELWLAALKVPEVAADHAARFTHVLVDEYQDTNYVQCALLDALAPHHRLMAVGDDAQCIYTWRGADIDNLLSFEERHPGAQVYKIETNYRSSPEILNVANAILQNQLAETGVGYTKELQAVKEHRARPALVQCTDNTHQARTILRSVAAMADAGYQLKDIAILYRAHFHAMELQMELSRAHLPYIITSGVRFFEQAHVRDLVAHLRSVTNPADEVAFHRLVCHLPRVGPKSAEKLYLTAHTLAEKARAKAQINLPINENTHAKPPAPAPVDAFALQGEADAHKNAHAGESEGMSAAPATNPHKHAQDAFFFEALASAAVLKKVPTDAKESFSSFAQTLIDLQASLLNEPPEKQIELIVEGWYGDQLRELFPKNWMSRRDDLESLGQFAAKHSTVDDLLSELTLLASESSDTDPNADALRLSTIHQAKGLEYPVVILIGLADGMFPLKRAIEADDVEEERRLFYVGVTRAEDALYLMQPKYITSGGPPSYAQPSRFLREIPEGLIDVPEGSGMQPMYQADNAQENYGDDYEPF